MTELEFANEIYPSEKRLLDVMKEIKNHISKQTHYSYYDLKKYIYDNDLYEWIICLRKPKYRQFVSTYLRDKHKSERGRYKSDYADAVVDALKAKSEFYKRHNFDDLLIKELETESEK